tara:strand:- start:441 stop:605 length:165 start_codon:yes stop_codon:yes gene_type:complete
VARSRLTVRLSLRWWLPFYIEGVRLMSEITGLEPDPAKVAYWVRKGVKTTVVCD